MDKDKDKRKLPFDRELLPPEPLWPRIVMFAVAFGGAISLIFVLYAHCSGWK